MKLMKMTKQEMVNSVREGASIRHPRMAIYNLLKEFEKSDMEVAEVIADPKEWADEKICAGTFKHSISTNKFNVVCTTRNGHVYLIRK